MEKEFISDNSNIIIGNMSLTDKKTYLDRLKTYLIGYRDNLNIKNTFGIEIEYEGIDYSDIEDDIQESVGWKSIVEKDFDLGGEVVTPVLVDSEINWKDLVDVLDIIKNSNYAYSSSKAGAHVHVGAHTLKNYNNLIKLILLYGVYEDILFRFGYMDRLNGRKSLIYSAAPLSIDLSEDLEDILSKHTINNIRHRYERFYGINFNNISSLTKEKEKNTIEYRFGNGTFDPVLWQNYINTCVKLTNASLKDLDVDKLIYLLLRVKEKNTNYYGFGKLDIDKAIEFSDIIFDNMLDKTNFLRQYIKDGSETVDAMEQTFSKPFTKVI